MKKDSAKGSKFDVRMRSPDDYDFDFGWLVVKLGDGTQTINDVMSEKADAALITYLMEQHGMLQGHYNQGAKRLSVFCRVHDKCE